MDEWDGRHGTTEGYWKICMLVHEPGFKRTWSLDTSAFYSVLLWLPVCQDSWPPLHPKTHRKQHLPRVMSRLLKKISTSIICTNPGNWSLTLSVTCCYSVASVNWPALSFSSAIHLLLAPLVVNEKKSEKCHLHLSGSLGAKILLMLMGLK